MGSKKSRNKSNPNQEAKTVPLPSLLVVTPSLDGNVWHGYLATMIQLQRECNKMGIRFGIRIIYGNSILPMARNLCVHAFAESDFTHALMLDSDVRVNPMDVIACIALDRDLSALPFSRRNPNWNIASRYTEVAAGRNPAAFPTMLAEANFTLADDYGNTDEEANRIGFVKVNRVGTAGMVIKKSLLAKFAAAYPERWVMDLDTAKQPRKLQEIFSYGREDGYFIGEDYEFCDRWREAGGDIWMKLDAKTSHHGAVDFDFDAVLLNSIAQELTERGQKEKPNA